MLLYAYSITHSRVSYLSVSWKVRHQNKSYLSCRIASHRSVSSFFSHLLLAFVSNKPLDGSNGILTAFHPAKRAVMLSQHRRGRR